MDTKSLKLRIINRLLRIDNPKLLKTVADILELGESPPSDTSSTFHSSNFPPLSTATPLDEEAQEIQDSLDDIFNSGKA